MLLGLLRRVGAPVAVAVAIADSLRAGRASNRHENSAPLSTKFSATPRVPRTVRRGVLAVALAAGLAATAGLVTVPSDDGMVGVEAGDGGGQAEPGSEVDGPDGRVLDQVEGPTTSTRSNSSTRDRASTTVATTSTTDASREAAPAPEPRPAREHPSDPTPAVSAAPVAQRSGGDSPAPPPTERPSTAPPSTTRPPTTTTAPPPPAGPWRAFKTNPDGSPVRWDPCTPIRYVTRLDIGPSFARSELDWAIRQIEAASGLDFVWVGDVAEPYSGRWPRQGPAHIGFATDLEVPLPPGASGWGIGNTVTDASGVSWYVGGKVVINPGHGWTQGTSSVNPLGLMFLHELGHMVGLAHVDSHNEVMGTGGNGSARSLGPGDRAGLAAVGRSAGCR